MSHLTIQVLGAPAVRLDGQPIALNERKVLALLIYLAVTGQSHRRDTLATLFWPEQNQRRARANLRRTLWTIRNVLGQNWLTSEGDAIQLTLHANLRLDLTIFQTLVARHHSQPHPTPTVLSELEDAVALYLGDFLDGFTLEDSPAFDNWQFFTAESARNTLATALDTLVEAYSQMNALEPAIAHARRRLTLDTLHEPAHCTLMHLYARSGRQAAALRQAEVCVRLLAEELGVEPEAETLALAAAIRAREIAPDISTPTHPPVTTMDRAATLAQPVTPDEQPMTERLLFVGREAQLDKLAQALTQILSGQGQLRIITGESGAGKSALLSEFVHRMQTNHSQVVVTIGACDAQTGVGDPFLPFRSALAWLTGTGGALPLHVPHPSQHVSGSACRALLEHGPDLVERFVSDPARQHLVNLAQSAGWHGELLPSGRPATRSQPIDQSRIFQQAVMVFKAMAAQFPLVLILEDLHWADSASIGLFFRLVRQLAEMPLLILATYRTEEVGAARQGERHPLVEMVAEMQRNLGEIDIDLEAARAVEGQTLVNGLLDAEPNRLDAAFRQALHRQTGGHPLFVVELLQDLKRTESLIRDRDGEWTIGASLDWQNLPARVEGAIAGRMAHLSDEQRWWLTIASVVGESFTVEVVAHVAGVEPTPLTYSLSQILQGQHRLVEAVGVDRLGPQRLTRYRFRHNLMQVYLYERLDAVQRVYLHEDVAHALEALYGEEAKQIALPLAHHYQAAGVAARAVDYLILAGEQAVRQAANEEAIHHFTQALSLLPELPESLARDQQEFALQFSLGRVLAASKGFASTEVGEAYSRALALGRQLEETGQIIQVLHGLTQYALYRSELALAQTYGQECLRLATESQDPERLLEVNQILRRIAHGLGQHAEAVTYGEHVIAYYRAHQPSLTFDDAYALAFTLAAMGLNLTPLGYPDRALRQAQEGLTLSQRHAHHFGTAYCLGFLAYIHLLRGDWREALQFAEAAVDVSDTYDFAQLRTFGQLHQGIALTRLGETDRGISVVWQAVAERMAMGITFGKPGRLARLAEASGQAGRVANGLALINDALADLEISNDRQYEPKLHQIKGDLLLLQNLPTDRAATTRQEAEACFRRAIKIAQSQGAKLWEARALASLCRLLHSQGRDEGSRQQLVDLYAWFTEGFETEDLRVVQEVLQESLL